MRCFGGDPDYISRDERDDSPKYRAEAPCGCKIGYDREDDVVCATHQGDEDAT